MSKRNSDSFWLDPSYRSETDEIELTQENSPEKSDSNKTSLRPRGFADYIGQEDLKKLLTISVGAAKSRGDALDHVLLHGPPGLGKTSMAMVLAAEMSVNVKVVSAPVIAKPGELAAILTSLAPFDILFIDEIHRLSRAVEEILYSAMEDYCIDILVGAGGSAQSVRLDLPKFTLVGATTRTGLLTAPLRDRFGLVCRLNFYTESELAVLVKRSASILELAYEDDAILEIGKRSRGTPRIANRLLKRVRDYVQHGGVNVITLKHATDALNLIGIDPEGLDVMDKRILSTIEDKYGGGPVGIDTIAASLSEDRTTIEDMYEPYLLEKGFLNRTRQGRVITEIGRRFIRNATFSCS